MQTAAFTADLEALIAMARSEQVAIMCAEAVPWRCHRSLIADALIARGVPAEEIVSERATRPHKLSEWARVENGNVTYPGVEV